ncbi:cilia- and flagella-associated protein 418-like isoform X3 [Dermacentor variabilis]|uniref:cilia- and flagella-associated protein 418-like isoform X3 n=1 Tax=Dermacentor variabilis TaxID=34621 RepID=UPI003F5B76B8
MSNQSTVNRYAKEHPRQQLGTCMQLLSLNNVHHDQLLVFRTSSDDSIEEAINEICRVPELNVPNTDLAESKVFGRRNIQACSHIHCCKCDFQVAVFEDYAWDETADYLFFRNSVPDASKLRSRLFRKLGWRAYCCQCHWRSVAALASAQQERLPWMCARH